MDPPTPQSLTLRLKHGRTTILLHTNPLTTFPAIKSALHTALTQTSLTSPTTRLPLTLPSSPSEYQFGVPVSASETARGFRLAPWEERDEDGEEEDAKGKGKGKAAKKGDGLAEARNCPKGQGLRDGAVLAFRWRGDGTGWEEREDEGEAEGDMWGVQLPSFEDAYGVENEGDLGGGGAFEG